MMAGDAWFSDRGSELAAIQSVSSPPNGARPELCHGEQSVHRLRALFPPTHPVRCRATQPRWAWIVVSIFLVACRVTPPSLSNESIMGDAATRPGTPASSLGGAAADSQTGELGPLTPGGPGGLPEPIRPSRQIRPGATPTFTLPSAGPNRAVDRASRQVVRKG